MGMTEQDIDEMMRQDGFSEETIRRSKLPLKEPARLTAQRSDFDWTAHEMKAKAEAAKPMEHFSTRKDWGAMMNPTRDTPREIKPLPERSNDRDRDR